MNIMETNTTPQVQTSNKLNIGIKDWIIISLFVIIIILLLCVGLQRNKINDVNDNYIIVNDELVEYKNKYNEEYALKNMYILENEQLRQYNEELYNEYKSLKDNPIIITKTEIVTQIDTVYTTTDSLKNEENIVKWYWSAQDSTFYKIKGHSSITYDYKDAKTVIEDLMLEAGIYLDVIDNGETLQVIAKTTNPYVSIRDVTGVMIDPNNSPTIKKQFKQKRWGIGPTISTGIVFGTDFMGKPIVGAGGLIGISIHYDLFSW